MTSQKRPREEDLEDVVLCIKVEKFNQRDHVLANAHRHYDEEDPKISRRIIRAVRNELINLINIQKLNGADVTEFEHILNRNEGTTNGSQQRILNSQSLYDKTNGRICTQNGNPQIRCPAKGLRVLPRLDYSHRYCEKTGKPLNRTEAKSEEKLFRTKSPKIAKIGMKRSRTRSDIEEKVEEYVEDGIREGSEQGTEKNMEEGIEEGMKDYVEQRDEGHMEESMNYYVEEREEESIDGRMNERMQEHADNDMEEEVSNFLSQTFFDLDKQDSVDDPTIDPLFTPSKDN